MALSWKPYWRCEGDFGAPGHLEWEGDEPAHSNCPLPSVKPIDFQGRENPPPPSLSPFPDKERHPNINLSSEN